MTGNGTEVSYYPFNKKPEYAVNKKNNSIYRIEKNPSLAIVHALVGDLVGNIDECRFKYITLNKKYDEPDVKEFNSLFDQWLMYPIRDKGGDILKQSSLILEDIYVLTILGGDKKDIELRFEAFMYNNFILHENNIRLSELTYKWFPMRDGLIPYDYYNIISFDLANSRRCIMVADSDKPILGYSKFSLLNDPKNNIIYQESIYDNIDNNFQNIKRFSNLDKDDEGVFDIFELKKNNNTITYSDYEKIIGKTWDSNVVTPLLTNREDIRLISRNFDDYDMANVFILNNIDNTIISEGKNSHSKYIIETDGLTGYSNLNSMNLYAYNMPFPHKDLTDQSIDNFKITNKDENISIEELYQRIEDRLKLGHINCFAIPVKRYKN